MAHLSFVASLGAAVITALACSQCGGRVEPSGGSQEPLPASTSSSGGGDDLIGYGESDGVLIDGGPYQSPDAGRPVATACDHTTKLRFPLEPGDGGACSTDSDCTAAANGHCVQSTDYAAPATTLCAYDACTTDSDCGGAHGVCGCHASSYLTNVCFDHSGCRVDADCASGQHCALSDPGIDNPANAPVTSGDAGPISPFYGNYAVGYFCTTPNDTCVQPVPQNLGSGVPACIFNPGTQRWEWDAIGP